MHEPLKYVTARPSLSNPKRWYWQRPGYDLVRLPADPVLRFGRVKALNDEADGKESIAVNSVAWVVEQYKASDDYLALKPGTLKYYKRILKDIVKMFGQLPFKEAMTRRVAVDFVKSYKAGMRRQAGAVLVNVYNTALYYQAGDINHAHKLRIKGGNRREQTFSADDIKKWLAHCDDDAMYVAFYILRFTAQRPNDALMMLWSQYNGDTITLVQEKTGKLIEVPCHKELRAVLDKEKAKLNKVRPITNTIIRNGLRPLSYTRFCVRFRKIADAAGLPKHQARDLRRTAGVLMSEAGATTQEVSAVGGWSIEYTESILNTYIPRNVKMARGAIKKWERKKPKV